MMVIEADMRDQGSMDIIGQGDFAISNAGGKTLFTFAIPPFEDKTDLYEKADAVNKENGV